MLKVRLCQYSFNKLGKFEVIVKFRVPHETTLSALGKYLSSIPLAISGNENGILITQNMPITFLVFCVGYSPPTWYRDPPEICRKDCENWKRVNVNGQEYMSLNPNLKLSELGGFEVLGLHLHLKFDN